MLAVLLTHPAIARASAGDAAVTGTADTATPYDGTPIIVLGGTLDLPPGAPAYGETVIDAARLRADASGRVEDVLRDVAGFSQFRRSDSRSANPSAQGANLRALGGNAASRTLLLLDGVPMADPFFGYIPYSAIVPDRLSAIRVTRGGGGGAFGAGAVAGTIAMVSATRADLPLASASALYGSRDATELSATLSPDVGRGFLSLSGRYDRGDGFDTTPASQRVAATAPARYEGWSTALRAVAPVGETAEVQARFLAYRDDRTLRFQGADSHAEGQDASIRLIARGNWQVDALAYVQARNFSNIVISSTSFRKTLDQRDTPALGLGGKVELRPPVGTDHLLRFGVDARHAGGMMREEAYDANNAANPLTQRRLARGRQLTAGAFVEDDWTPGTLGGALVLTGGARIDRWTIRDARVERRDPVGAVLAATTYPNRSGWEASGRVGALWIASPALSLRAAAYTGFRLPTLNELYRGFTVFPITTNANAALVPERLRGAEIGLDLTPAPGVALGLTAFDNRLDDAIANVSLSATVRERRNVRAIAAQGLELTASATLGHIALSGSYTYSYSKVRAPGTPLDGRDPAQSPRHAGSATLAWTPREGARIAGTLRHSGAQYEDDLSVDHMPAALTVDAFARLPLGRGVALVGRAENIFDEAIYTRRVSSPSLSEDLGTPRTLWIGVELALGR
ncbi:TonB-dependent receptor plug domain-containing protein [Sphingobium sufflavum]|uniref:TonB-dependent receptor plug domain-containing protein n=1 Tax=Sphingobium sufflavum TaxID=1129547 RepID=UPI00389A2302